MIILCILYSITILAGLGLVIKPQLALKGKKNVNQEDVPSLLVAFRTSGYCVMFVGLAMLVTEIITS